MAGSLKARQVILGDAVDTTKNFVFEVPAVPDGTLTIKRESGTVVATVSTAGVVAFAGNAQTWQDVKTTPGRVLGTPYQNLTGQPIKVNILGTCNADAALVANFGGAFSVTGSVAYANGKGTSVYFEVPIGATYTVSAPGGVLLAWLELRQ